MSRTSGELLSVPIDRRAATPLFRQVYAGLTAAILERRLRLGARLPASRALAGRLGLSRTAFVAAYEQLFVLVILRHKRRRLISQCVTDHPTAEWIARQITEAFPWDDAPDYLIQDRDAAYGHAVTRRLAAMGIRDHPTAPRSPWQNGHAERLIGSIRRECLDHIVVFGEAHLRRILTAYATYYNDIRTYLSLGKDSPRHRAVQRLGLIVVRPILGGLHHQYCRI
jgi:DNA-binding transcriptional regulator YhcF (GntR family)